MADEVTDIVPHTVNAMAPEQIEQVINWYAAGHSPRDIVSFADTEFSLVLDESEARLLWTSHTTEIAEAVRRDFTAMRKNPYYEPSFVVSKLNMLLFGLEQMIGSAISENATGPTAKLVGVWLSVLGRMDEYQPKEGKPDDAGAGNFAELMRVMDPVDRARVERLLAEINEIVGVHRVEEE